MSSYAETFQAESLHATDTTKQLLQHKVDLSRLLDQMGAENLRKLKDLREHAETDPVDLRVFIEQLHIQNQAFNFKDKIKQLEEVDYLLSEPYFARIDLSDSVQQTTKKVYIGRFGFVPGATVEPLITDWRAKIASVYYRYRYPQKNVSYETPNGIVTRDLTLKRTFEFNEGQLIKYYNNDIQLDEREIISAKIAKRTGGVLEDIIATIQESQMAIITYDPRGVCIVQGCVGSGKSTVAIHKLSHIFFNYPDLIRPQNSFLVAKSQILVGYLCTLFPKLGIFDLNYGTLKDLIIRLTFSHKIKLNLALENEGGLDTADLQLVNDLRAAVAEATYTVIAAINKLTANEEYSSYLTFVYDRDLSIKENIFAVIEDLEEEHKHQKQLLDEGITGPREAKTQINLVRLKKLMKELRKLAANLQTTAFPSLIKTFTAGSKNQLGYQDALSYLYLYAELLGLPNFKQFDYCVVDEGQDFSPLEYLFLNQLVQRGRFCILGDLNQSVLKTGLKGWDSVSAVINEAKQCKLFELTTNYRSTKQIIDYACKIVSPFTQEFLPESINRMGPEVTTLTGDGKDSLALLHQDMKQLDKSIGIICFKPADFDLIRNEFEDRLIILNPKDRIFYTPKGVYLTMFDNCKGLEFAKVYVLGMSKQPADFEEAKKNYVAVTRAMNELVVVHS